MANAVLPILGQREGVCVIEAELAAKKPVFGGIGRLAQFYNHATIQKKAFLAQFGISIWPRERKLLLAAITLPRRRLDV